MHPEKADLRTRLLLRRATRPAAEVADASRRICERLAALPELRSAGLILAYWPMLDRGEVDIRPFLLDAVSKGIRVGLPIIAARDPVRRLAFGPYESEGALRPGPFGILQPRHAPDFAWDRADIVVVPGLAASPDGDRLGYGGGHYDRFLRVTNAFTVMPLFADCLLDSLPVEPHDVPIEMLVTEREEIRTATDA